MQFDKSSATHIWTGNTPLIWLKQLTLYKMVEDKWMVYSDITGWRVSHNESEWFNKETNEGFFRPLTEGEKDELAKRS